MSSSVVVVVIVGAVILAIAYATIGGEEPHGTGSQPATAWRPAELGGEATEPDGPAGPDRSATWSPPAFGAPEEPPASPAGEPFVPPTPARRLRSTLLLLVAVGVLGAAAAAGLGLVTLIVVQVMDGALGP